MLKVTKPRLWMVAGLIVFAGTPSRALADKFEGLQKKCGHLEKQIQAASAKTSDSARMIDLQDLKILIGELKQEGLLKSDIPKSYWQACLNKSVELLRAYTGSASPALRLSPAYLVLISELYETQDSPAMALSFMDEAIKNSKDDPALRIRAVRLWLSLEEKKARELPSKSRGTPGQAALMRQRLESYLKSVIDNPRGTTESRLAALEIHSAFLEKTGSLVDAAADWQTITLLDPRNIRYLRKIAAFETSRGALPKAISVLNKIIEIDPTDLAAHKSLVRIYTNQKDFRSAKTQSRLALKYHPKDPELQSILRLDPSGGSSQ